MKTDSFCTKCQADTSHAVSMDHNNELVFTCPCGHFIKTPALEPAALKAHLAAHRAENFGRKLLNQAEEARKAKAKADYLKSLAEAGIVSSSDAFTITPADVGPVPV
jgi:hypothetical protein